MNRLRAQVQEHVAPNLIPMIDIMFLLLLFFMLGSDMTQREFEPVKLPRSREAKEEARQTDGRLTINACHIGRIACASYDRSRVCRDESHWQLVFRGEDCTKPGALSAALARTVSPEGAALSERKVMIRADGSAPFGLAQRAMAACAEHRLYKVQVGAAIVKTN